MIIVKRTYLFIVVLILAVSLFFWRFIFSGGSESKQTATKVLEPSQAAPASLLKLSDRQKASAPSADLPVPSRVLQDGVYKTYYPHGVPQAIFHIKNGKLDDIRQIFAEDGTIIREEAYKEGQLQGISKVYYESGALKAEIHFVDNKREGLSKVYTPTGALWAEEIYKDNKLNGTTKSYYPTGQLMFEMTFQEGVPLSRKQFYPLGALLREEHFQNSKLNGVSKFYSETGQVMAEVTYQDDIAIALKKFDPDGKIIRELKGKDKIPEGDALFKLIQETTAS